MFLVLLLYALFASVFTFEKLNLQNAQPLFLVGSQMLTAGTILLTYQFFFRRADFQIPAKNSIWMIFRLAIFNIYLNNIFEFLALRYLDSFKTCLFYSLSPFFAAMFSYYIFSERLSWRKLVGLSIGFLGFIPNLLDNQSAESRLNSLFFISWEEGIMFLAAISSVYGWILLRQLVRDGGYSAFMANGLSMFIGGIIALINSMFVETWDPVPVTNVVGFLQCTFMLILISNLICYNLYGFLLKRFSATFMSFAGFMTPLFTAFFGWLFLGEVVTWAFLASAAIVFLGLLIFSQEELQGSFAQTSGTVVNG